MTPRLRTLVLVALAGLALPALANAAPAATRGIVVQRDVGAGTIVLASQNGALHRIRTASPGRLTMGSLVQVRGSRISVIGHARSAKVRGVVMRRALHSYALAGNGAVLAVTTPAPPAAGQQVTATVQVTPTALSDDGQVQVGTQAPSAELHGTVLAQDATTLRLGVDGFPAGLVVSLGGQTIAPLAVGTQIEARVTLAPDPSNPAGIVLTLVSLHAENGNGGQGGGDHGSALKAEGQVTALTEAGPAGGAPGTITVVGEHGSVTFAIPAGFGPTGAAIGDRVEARGTPSTVAGGLPTLVRLEGAGHQGDGGGDDEGAASGSGKGGSGVIGAGAGGPVSKGSGDGSGNDD